MKSYCTDLFLFLKKCAQHSAADFSSMYCFTKGKTALSRATAKVTINWLSSWKYLDTLKNTFVERSSQYTLFTPKKAANAGSALLLT